jgi:translation initiation factor 3 subunit L
LNFITHIDQRFISQHTTMSLRQVPAYQQLGAEAVRAPADESDAEEEALADDYRQQVQYDQDGLDELDRTSSLGGGSQDIHAQLAAAATPLEFQATLETKFASYDNYCSLFHYILNSDGPVDLEVPSVSGIQIILK